MIMVMYEFKTLIQKNLLLKYFFIAHADGIWDVAWSNRTNLVISGSEDNTIKCW